jgi:hypothetical protein
MLCLGSSTLRGEVMQKFGTMLVALVAIILTAPTALAFDCDSGDIADCVESIVKAPPIRQVIPSIPGPRAVLKGECDAFDEDDVKACLRGLKVPGVGQRSKPDPRPAAPAPAEGKPVEKSEAAPSPATAAAAHVEPNITPPRCQKYFPAVGQLVDVPCRE